MTELDGLPLDQLLIAAAHSLGRNQALASVAVLRDHVAADACVERWRVRERGKPVYSLWLFAGNTGTFLRLRERTPLCDVKQGTIQPSHAPLSVALQRCAPF